MGTAEKLLAKMRNTPRDWRIDDLIAVARSFDVKVRNPDGSHVVFSFPGLAADACVPAHRPIKPVYVKRFLALIDQTSAKEE